MHPFVAQLLHSPLDLRLCDVTENEDTFTVRLRRGGPRVALGLLFGAPGLMLLWNGVTTHTALNVALAVVFSPLLLLLGAVFGLLVSTREFRRNGECVETLQLGNWTVSERAQPPADAACVLVVVKTPATIGCHISVPGSSSGGFSIHRDHPAALAFAARLGRFLRLPVKDEVPLALRTKR